MEGRERERERTHSQHPCGILNVLRIGFDIAMIEGTAIVHINLVIIFEVNNKGLNITSNGTFRSCIRAVVWTKSAVLLMPKPTMISEYILTAKNLVSAW